MPRDNYTAACDKLMAPVIATLTKHMPKTPPTNMTHEELERWHYANGDTALAALHAAAADGEAAVEAAADAESDEIARLQDELDKTHGDLDDANAEIDHLTDKVSELEDELAEMKNLA